MTPVVRPRNVLIAASAVLAISASLVAETVPQKPTPAQAAETSRGAATAGNQIFGLTKLHRLRLSISAYEWSVLQTSGARGGPGTGGTDYRNEDGRLIHAGSGFAVNFPWASADFRVDDPEFKAEFKNVGLRYKGNSSFSRSSATAPLLANFKLRIDLHGTKGAWDGERTFNLHPGVIDTSKMKDAIAYAIFTGAGVPAPRTAFAEIFFTVPGVYNDVSAGLFTIIEDVNKTFLERALPPGTGLLMKPEGLRGGIQFKGDTWAAYSPTLRPDREATAHEQQRVIEFARLISQADTDVFRSNVETYLDVDEFLRFIAVHALIANTDSYVAGGHNYYLYLDPKDDKFRFIPWDQDLSMGNNGRLGGPAIQFVVRPGAAGAGDIQVRPAPPTVGGRQPMDVMHPFSGDQPLISRLLDDPVVAVRYRAIVAELAASVFTKAKMTEMVDTLEKIGTGRGPSPRAFLESQADYLQQLVASWK